MKLISIPTVPTAGTPLPEPLIGLRLLAMNLRWTWRSETQDLFRQLDPKLWASHAGPIRMLREVRDWTLWTSSASYAAAVQSEASALEDYLGSAEGTWFNGSGFQLGSGPVAYFCAEYALHTGMNQYAGGLGILAGDHCKEASDLGLPFVAVGLFYSRGFFRQMIDWSGRQECLYPLYEPEDLPMERIARLGTAEALTVDLELPGRTAKVGAWLMQVGRTPLILLDTDLPENRPEDRKITSQLYTNFREMRIHQELVLGAGGVRVLEALGIQPSCFHLNEGHSAFLLLERMRALCGGGCEFKVARTKVAKNAILTIHTPVPEGNERFDARLTRKLISPMLNGTYIRPGDVLKLGSGADGDPNVFDMTAFALRCTCAANGVSLLHGETADKTWRAIAQKSVIGVTNGAHMPTWLGPEVRRVLGNSGADLGAATRLKIKDEPRPLWEPALTIDPSDLWKAHQAQKRALIDWAQLRLFEAAARRGGGPDELASYGSCLDPNAFLIGFARRFATYKRASLMFADLRRISKLLDSDGRRVQVLIAGKSHPADRSGQALIEQVYAITQSKRFKGKVFLLEDYDMETGAMLTQGVDLWLNNPRRPLEASGTSGMKAAANGVPNCSVLDGWWDEAYVDAPLRNGWAIGGRIVPKSVQAQDRQDAAALYSVLERDVLPMFFDRDPDGVPQRWVEVMRGAIATSLYSFSTARMIRDYVKEMYEPASVTE